MISKRIASLILAMIMIYSSGTKTKQAHDNIDYNFDPIITQFLDEAIENHEREEQERIAYEEYLKQEEYKRQNPEFTKYDLTEDELKAIARLCQQEQSTLKGSAAEASLMANLYELYGGDFKSLYSYVKNSGWFYRASYFMSLIDSLDKETLEIVRLVLVEGKRTLPKYVDNHDDFSNIISINTGNSNCREDYIPNETIITNGNGSNYLFYCFPDEISDPFGYNNPENIEKFGDAHYDVERLILK